MGAKNMQNYVFLCEIRHDVVVVFVVMVVVVVFNVSRPAGRLIGTTFGPALPAPSK